MSTAVFTACGTGIKNSSERSNSSVSMQTQNINIEIENLVKAIEQEKENDTSALENQIDFLVYHLYGLTYDEVLIVDPETPISREEYEAYKEE